MRFTFLLAKDLGGGTRAELMERMSSSELTYWMAHYELTAEEEEAAIERARNAR